MQVEGFIICDDQGQPFACEMNDDVAVDYSPEGIPIFNNQQSALDILNGLPATASFEGFENGTVRKATLTIGEIVANQDEVEEDEE